MDNNGPFGVLMTDLSKAFDCLHYGLLIAKLDGFGFDIKPVKLIQQYLTNRKQRVKVDDTCISWRGFFMAFYMGQSLVRLFSISFHMT